MLFTSAAKKVPLDGPPRAVLQRRVKLHTNEPGLSNGTWEQKIIFDFSNNAGNIDAATNPTGQLTYYKGVLYGYAGNGASEGGTIYTLTQSGTTWTQSTIYSFGGYPDGWNPAARPFFGKDGTMYGLTFYGGLNDAGVFFSRP